MRLVFIWAAGFLLVCFAGYLAFLVETLWYQRRDLNGTHIEIHVFSSNFTHLDEFPRLNSSLIELLENPSFEAKELKEKPPFMATIDPGPTKLPDPTTSVSHLFPSIAAGMIHPETARQRLSPAADRADSAAGTATDSQNSITIASEPYPSSDQTESLRGTNSDQQMIGTHIPAFSPEIGFQRVRNEEGAVSSPKYLFPFGSAEALRSKSSNPSGKNDSSSKAIAESTEKAFTVEPSTSREEASNSFVSHSSLKKSNKKNVTPTPPTGTDILSKSVEEKSFHSKPPYPHVPKSLTPKPSAGAAIGSKSVQGQSPARSTPRSMELASKSPVIVVPGLAEAPQIQGQRPAWPFPSYSLPHTPRPCQKNTTPVPDSTGTTDIPPWRREWPLKG